MDNHEVISENPSPEPELALQYSGSVGTALAVIEHRPEEAAPAPLVDATPEGSQGPLDEIFAAGLKQMPDSARRYKHPKMRELVAFCQELQRRSAPYPFWLSCRAAASVLNIGRQTANNGLLKLQHDGILERVHAGSRGRAAEYFYRGTKQEVPDE